MSRLSIAVKLCFSVAFFSFAVLAVPAIAEATNLGPYLYCVDVNDGRVKEANIDAEKVLDLAEKARKELAGEYSIVIQAECWEAAGQYKKAIRVLEKLKGTGGKGTKLDARLGELHKDMGEYKTAIRYFQAALEGGSGSVKLDYNMAESYFALKKYKAAKNVLEKYIKERGRIKPQGGDGQVSAMMDVEIYRLYALTLSELGDSQSAVESIFSLLERNRSTEICNMVIEVSKQIAVGKEADKLRSMCR